MNAQLEFGSEKARWVPIDIGLLPRAEASTSGENDCITPGEINRALAEKVADRILEAVKCLRKQEAKVQVGAPEREQGSDKGGFGTGYS